MKQILSLATERRILIGAAAVLVAVAVFYFFVAEAVTVRPVGTLSVLLAPNAGDAGTEFVQLEYSGFGEADLDGWTLHNSDGQVFDLTGIFIPSAGKVRICEEDATDTRCDAHWNGTDVFADDGDALIVIDDYAAEAARLSYSTSDSATTLTGSADYIAEVHGKKDKILLCHAQKNKDGYRAHDASTNSLVQSFEKDNKNHANHPDDIIPNFFYDVGKGIGYFPGINWPDGKTILENNCT